MPRAVVLLFLLLLLGGHLLISHSVQGPAVFAPHIDAKAKLVRGEGNYTLVLEGDLNLPENCDYVIHSITTSILVDGVSTGSKSFGSAVVSGPTVFPFSFSPSFSPSAGTVAVRVDASVSAGNNNYTISTNVPVAIPDRNLLVRDPNISIWLSSLRLLGSTKSLSFSISMHNPNDAELRFDSLHLSAGNSEYPLEVDKIPANSSTTLIKTITVPSNVQGISLDLAGKYFVNGVSNVLERSFDVNVPELSEQQLRFHIFADVLSLSRNGYELNIFGSVHNPNAFNVALDSLVFKAVQEQGDGNILQSSSILSDVDLLPKSTKSFSKNVRISSALANAVAEVVAERGNASSTVASFPLPLINPPSFLDPPSVKLSALRDANLCSVTPVLSGPDYNVDVSLSLTLKSGSTILASHNYGDFLLAGSKTLESVGADVNGMMEASISGKYGIREMNILFPLRYSIELNCST